MRNLENEAGILELPDIEIARNVARLNRIVYAVDQEAITDRDEAQTAWELAVPATKESRFQKYWSKPEQRQTAYEALVIHGLQRGLDIETIHKATSKTIERIDMTTPPQHANRKEVSRRSDVIYEQAHIDALGRVGLLAIDSHNSAVIPLGALAALHYQRADIHSPIDRTLYARSGIDEAITRIEAQVPPRILAFDMVEILPSGAEGPTKEKEMSVYKAAAYVLRDVSNTVERFGYEAHTPVEFWWQELAYDLGRIDEVSGNL